MEIIFNSKNMFESTITVNGCESWDKYIIIDENSNLNLSIQIPISDISI